MSDILARLHATLSARAASDVPRETRPARIESAGDDATVWIYDFIGCGGVSAAELAPELATLKSDKITVRVNSPGGDYFDGVAIANALARHPATVDVHVDGLAASAASIVAMAGDHVVMHPGAQMMIHDALTLTVGNAAEHEKTARLLDSASADIAALYASRAGGTADEWRTRMVAETWFTSPEAVAAGLAHEAPTADDAAPAKSEAEPAPRWAALLQEWRDVPRETPTPPAPAEVATPAASSPVPGSIAARLCSAFSERKAP